MGRAAHQGRGADGAIQDLAHRMAAPQGQRHQEENRHAAGQRLRTLQRESAHGPPYQPGSQQRRRHQQHQRRQQHAETKPETGQNQGHEARHAGKEASDISIKCARPAPEPSARPVLSRCAGGLSPQGDWHPSTARADSRCLSRRGQAPGRCRDGKRPPRCARCAGLLPPEGAFLPWGGPAAKKGPHAAPAVRACCPPRGLFCLGAARRQKKRGRPRTPQIHPATTLAGAGPMRGGRRPITPP
ncbi:Uncharacterised protein [Bordetella pertussis]|nr:Uncharacterised protein [Bordetella pertussis]